MKGPLVPKSIIPQRNRRVLPVMVWLQIGVAATGVGIALAAAPTATADDGAASAASSDQSTQSAQSTRSTRSAAATPAAAERSAQRRSTGASTGASRFGAGPVRQQAADSPEAAVSARASRIPAVTVAAASARTDRARVPLAPRTAAQGATPTGVLGDVAAFFGLPGAPATPNPTIDSVPMFLRLQVEDIIGGVAPPTVSDPATVITGLFRQVLRKDPSAAELQNYTGIYNLTGINGVVSGLYSSTAFRQSVVQNYYLELLNREATSQELGWGTFLLEWVLSEPAFAASIAGSNEFYAASNAGGGPDGPTPSAKSFVNLLYRTLVGTPPDPVTGPIYEQQIQSGRPTGLVATEFVTTEQFRQVKVIESFQVLGLSAIPEVVQDYVDNWFWYGGLGGINTRLLASGTNIFNIEAGRVQLPDMAAAAQLQQLLLAPYADKDVPTGFYALFNTFFNNPTEANNCKKTPDNCANPGLYELLSKGGVSRGIPNEAITVKQSFVPVSKLLPSQNEIGLDSSLGFPLGKDPSPINGYFNDLNVKVGDRYILTSADGQYVVDGHHRWSQLFLINPLANIGAADIGYVPAPQDALKETQISVAAQIGYFKTEESGTDNLFTISQEDFNRKITDIINKGIWRPGTPDAGKPTKPAVLAVFTANLGLEGQTDDEKIDSIENYLWKNVLDMRANNFYVDNATGRPVMPQAGTIKDPFQPVLVQMKAPSALSYSFPIISYLG